MDRRRNGCQLPTLVIRPPGRCPQRLRGLPLVPGLPTGLLVLRRFTGDPEPVSQWSMVNIFVFICVVCDL